MNFKVEKNGYSCMHEARRNYEQLLVGNRWETYDELHCGWFFLCSTRENTTYLRGDVVCFYSGALPRPKEPGWGGGTTVALHTDPFHQYRSTLSDPLFGVPLTVRIVSLPSTRDDTLNIFKFSSSSSTITKEVCLFRKEKKIEIFV